MEFRRLPFPLSRSTRRSAAFSATLAAALAAAFPCHADSETLTLDSVVVTGSRVEHSSFDLPAAVDSVDARTILESGPRVNASEALSGVPGINVANRQNYAQDLQISSRGFGARSAFGVRGIRLVADGIPASMPDGQGQAASFNLDRAERIEVMRGPMSAIYGNSAGGVVQLFTRDGQGTPGVDGRFSAGSYGSWKADLSSDGQVGPVGYVIDASRFATEGYREHSAAERDQTMVKLNWSPTRDGKLTFVASTFRQKADDPLGLDWNAYRQAPASATANALLYNTRKTIEQTQGGINYTHRFGEQLIELTAYTGSRSVRQYQAIPQAAQANPRHSGGVIDFDRDYAGASARWSGRFPLAGGQMTTSLGLEFERSEDDRRGYENFSGATLGVLGNLRRKETDTVSSFAQYAQAEWQRGDLSLSAGLRHNRVAFVVKDEYITGGANGDDSGNVTYERTTPLVSALYRLTPAVNLYASFAKGFETPTLNELFYSGSGGSFNFGLAPSDSKHAEIGVKAYVGSDTRVDLAAFHIGTRNELVVDGATGGRTSYRNAGGTTRRGLELAVDSRWAGNFSSRLAYGWLDARYDQDFATRIYDPVSGTTQPTTVNSGSRLPGVAAHNLFAELVWRDPGSGFYAGVEGVARAKVYVEDSNRLQAAPGYAIANLRAGIERRFGAMKLGAFARLDNVFDRQYVGSVIVGDTNGRFYESAPGRNWLAGVSLGYRF